MGSFLIAAADPSWVLWILEVTINILKVAIGLGMVIFVHELGHFLLAKLCGVKVEKFYLGFDIAGGKLAKFTRGETEYGIGILPLGGYVKMLGQEDNPARLREEIERAKAPPAASADPEAAIDSDGPPAAVAVAGQASADTQADLARAQQALYDPRSYLAQSVPKRMAIISAGVVMNVIFAFVVGVIAFGIGVEQTAPVVGAVAPGDGAWRAGVRVGDRIVRIGDTPIHTFVDIQSSISLGNSLDGVRILLDRPGLDKPLWVEVKAEKKGIAPTIGVTSSGTTVLGGRLPALPGSPASDATPAFREGDRIVAIDGQPIARYADIYTYLASHPEKTLTVTVERAINSSDTAENAAKKMERLTIEVAPAPVQQLGLVMQMGPITAVQADSPGEKAGLLPGDKILRVNGQPAGDPMVLPDRLRQMGQKGERVRLTIGREGRSQPLEIEAALRPVKDYDTIRMPYSPVSAPALGVAYSVTSQVEEVLPNSPAALAGIKPDDVVTKATVVSAAGQQTLVLQPGKGTWPSVMSLLQFAPSGTYVELMLKSGRNVRLEPVKSKDWFDPDRGFLFQPLDFQQQATSFADALHLGARETRNALTMVFRTVQRLLDNQVSPKGLMGPVGIAKLAYQTAARGTGELLLFLTLLSANLAVLNFLPIPVLDGGHMVFLAYEGITGKPPSERVQLALTYLGLLLLLTLMVWVLGLDVGLISR